MTGKRIMKKIISMGMALIMAVSSPLAGFAASDDNVQESVVVSGDTVAEDTCEIADIEEVKVFDAQEDEFSGGYGQPSGSVKKYTGAIQTKEKTAQRRA